MKTSAGKIDVVKAGHIELFVTDLKEARKFYVQTLGFVVTKEGRGRLYLRGLEDRQHHCLVLTEADRPGVGHIAFKVADEGSLVAIEQLVGSRGGWVRWSKKGDEDGIGKALLVRDPFGFPVEFYSSMDPEDWMLQKFEAYRGAKVMRLDHFNIMLPDVKSAYDWYSKTLGFTCTESTETEGDKPELWAAWLRRKHTCHDIALTTGIGPRVHHAGFTVPDRGAIMDCADILASSGYLKSMERGPGRHGVSNAFFLYLRDPDGNRIELYTGDYLSADPDWKPIRWKLNDPQRQTFWGAPTPASWFNEAMLVRSPKSGAPEKTQAPKIQDRPDYLLSAR
ncbi:MAG TPA: 3,4-dihydroxyphenylacetate 2,3-dioxygenase [Nitrososphaerales archaeon]|nr:3,4-dihydroxyphenylacetate 2,3-dioxygenase [Nitrososphaerales archaeon]